MPPGHYPELPGVRKPRGAWIPGEKASKWAPERSRMGA